MAINALRFEVSDENVEVVHIYFDYKAHQSQTALSVATSLLKQLLIRLDFIPQELESMYSTNTKLNMATCKAMLFQCARKVGTIYAVFDAVDECNETNFTEILEFLAHFQNSFKILLSTRPRRESLPVRLFPIFSHCIIVLSPTNSKTLTEVVSV